MKNILQKEIKMLLKEAETFAKVRVDALKDKTEWNASCIYHEAFNGYIVGSTETSEKMYSEEDLKRAFKSNYTPFSASNTGDLDQDFSVWLAQFKNKKCKEKQ